MTIEPATIEKLGKLFPRLASDHDGEVVATARAIIRTLQAAGSSLHELGPALAPKAVQKVVYRDRPEPEPANGYEYVANKEKSRMVRLADVLLNQCDLSAREEEFIRHMRKKAAGLAKMRISVKQKAWWDSLVEDYGINEEEAA